MAKVEEIWRDQCVATDTIRSRQRRDNAHSQALKIYVRGGPSRRRTVSFWLQPCTR